MEGKRADGARFEQGPIGVPWPVVSYEGKAFVRKGPGYNGVRHLSGRSRGHRDFGDIGVPTQAARALGRYRERYQQLVGNDSGQSTVEYAAILFGVLAVVAGLAAVFELSESGLLMQHALQSASHHVGGSVAGVVDAFMY